MYFCRLSPPVTGTVRVTNSDLVIGEYKLPKDVSYMFPASVNQ